MEQIFARLRNPEFESSSLIGERRMGKTSVLNHISNQEVMEHNGLDPARYFFVYTDLQMLPPDTTPTRFYQHLLRRLGNKVEALEVKESLQEIVQSDAIDNFDLSDLFDIIDQKEMYVILLLDEFENIDSNGNFGPDFYYGLRSLAIHQNLALVTASRTDLVEISRSDAVRSSPFFNIFATIHLQPYTTKDVGEFLQTYLNDTGVSFGQTEVQYLWQIAGGNPFLLQMASSIFFRAHQEGRDERQSLALVHSEFPTAARPHLHGYWKSATDEEKTVPHGFGAAIRAKVRPGQELDHPSTGGVVSPYQ